MDIKQGVMAAVIIGNSMVVQGAGSASKEKWVANLEERKPYVTSIVLNTTGMVCKNVNGTHIYISPKGGRLPGINNFIELDDKGVKIIVEAPNCKSSKKVTKQ